MILFAIFSGNRGHLSGLAAEAGNRPRRRGDPRLSRRSKRPPTGGPDKMDALVAAITDRINPGGQKEISVRSLGNNMVQIIMPTVSGANGQGQAGRDGRDQADHQQDGGLGIPHRRHATATTIRSSKPRRRPARRPGRNAPAPTTTMAASIPIPRRAKRKSPNGAASATKNGKEVENVRYNPATAPATIQLSYKDKEGNEITHTEVLVMAPDADSDVTGKDLRNAQSVPDQEHGGFEVAFRFKGDGGQRFGNLTGRHVPLDGGAFKYHLAIVLDHVLQSAATINSRITDSGLIEGGSGGFDKEYADELAEIINRGSLPAALYPTPEREMITDATLGADTIRQSLSAMIIAAIVVPLFMLYYYRFAGPGGRGRALADRAPAGGHHGAGQGALHADRAGRTGAGRGHGGGQQRADLRALARRTRATARRCGWRCATRSIAWAWSSSTPTSRTSWPPPCSSTSARSRSRALPSRSSWAPC